MNSKTYDKLIWIDLEMTGLEIESCYILEIACVVTDNEFNIIAESPSIAIHQHEYILENMNEWCIKTHKNNGLIKRSYESKINVVLAEEQILQFLSIHVDKRKSPMCGNCVWQDRKFLAKYMPRLESYFTHQMLDLSTARILNSVCYTNADFPVYQIQNKHLAIEDIKDHIREFKHYREKFNLK